MIETYGIGLGDTAMFYIAEGVFVKGVVKSKPAATGDTWVVVNKYRRPGQKEDTESVYEIQQFLYAELIEKGEFTP